MTSGIVRSVKPVATVTEKQQIDYISLKGDGQCVFYVLVSSDLSTLGTNPFAISYNSYMGKVKQEHLQKYADMSSGRAPSEWLSLPEIGAESGQVTPFDWLMENKYNKKFETFIANAAQNSSKGGYFIGNAKTQFRVAVLWDGNVYDAKTKTSIRPTDLQYNKLAILSFNQKGWDNFTNAVQSFMAFAPAGGSSTIVGQLMSTTRSGAARSPQTTYNTIVHPPQVDPKNYDLTQVSPEFDISTTIYGGNYTSQLYKMRDLGIQKWCEDNDVECPFDFSLIEKNPIKDTDDVPF